MVSSEKVQTETDALWGRIWDSPQVQRLSKLNLWFLREVVCLGWQNGALVIRYPQSCEGPISRMLPSVRDALVRVTGDPDVEIVVRTTAD